MEGNAAHGRPLLQTAVLACQGQFQHLGCRLRILKKHFVKIAEPVEQNTVGILSLGLQVVRHHRGKCHCLPHFEGFLPSSITLKGGEMAR